MLNALMLFAAATSASAAEPVQSPARYEAAIHNASTAPSYVMVTSWMRTPTSSVRPAPLQIFSPVRFIINTRCHTMPKELVQGEMVAEYHKFYGSAGMMISEIHNKIQKK